MTIDDLIWIGVGLLVGAAGVLLIQGKKGPGYALLAAAAALIGVQIGRASNSSSTQQDDPRVPTGLDADTEPGLVTEIHHKPTDHTTPEDRDDTHSSPPALEPGNDDLSDAVDWLESRAGADNLPE